ncbi:MAG: hypothetical protein M1822_006931 [Bathelium mastoideum]|nr:MAG: hypothetical protein M1822_006931 [Bathelium mastoideum]
MAWSQVPRLYTILRTIGQLHLLDDLIDQGINDYWFPFSAKSVQSITLSSPAQSQFLDSQKLVLTRAVDLEKNVEKKHIHFSGKETIPFKELGELGRGGYGKVDKVFSQFSQRELARKLFKRQRGGNKAAVQSFINELRVLKKIRHHHCVELIASYTDARYFGIIMLPVAECNLHGFYTRASGNPEGLKILRTFFGCLASAVNYLHSNKIRHRDIKPENILVKGTDIYLTDFGISLDWEHLSRSTTVAESGKTPLYCAPEVASHQKRNSSSDIWSLGCIFLEMCTILNGRALDDMQQCFKHSSGTHAFYQNLSAITDWSLTLRNRGFELDNDPINWSTSMLKSDPNSRPSASELYEKISRCKLKSDHDAMAFCRDCCIADDEEDSPNGSVSDGELWAENSDDEVTSPPLTHEASHAAASTSSAQNVSSFDKDSSVSHNHPDDLVDPIITRQMSSAADEEQLDGQNGPEITESIARLHFTSEYLTQSPPKVMQPIPAHQLNDNANLPKTLSAESQSLQPLVVPKYLNLSHREQNSLQTSIPEGQSADSPSQETHRHPRQRTTMEFPQQDEDPKISKRLQSGIGPIEPSSTSESWGTIDDPLLDPNDIKQSYDEDCIELPRLCADDWETPSSLMKAVENDKQVMNYLSDRYSELPAIRQSGSIYVACVVQSLIEMGLDVNAEAYKCKNGETPIWKVLKWSQGDEFEPLFSFMIQSDADITTMSELGGKQESIFTQAGGQDKLWAATILIKCKSPKPKAWREELCWCAVTQDRPDLIQRLMDLGKFDFNGKTFDGETCFNTACFYGAQAMVQFMLDTPAFEVDVDHYSTRRQTPLYVACKSGHLGVVRLLRARGASLDKISTPFRHQSFPFDGAKPIHVAAEFGHDHVLKHLLEVAGDRISINERSGRASALYLACINGHTEVARRLLAHGADPNITLGVMHGNWSCLHVAASDGKTDMVKLLLNHGATMSTRTVPVFSGRATGNTPLSLAEEGGHKGVVELLNLVKAQEKSQGYRDTV